MIHEIAERLDEVIGWYEGYGCERVEEIHNGFEWTEFSRHDCDTSYHVTPSQTESWNKQYENMIESFLDDYADKLPDDINKDNYWDKIRDDDALQELMSDYENEWFDPALLRLSIQDGEVFLSINYNDQPYYRYQYDETILKIECCENVDETIKAMKKAYEEYIT